MTDEFNSRQLEVLRKIEDELPPEHEERLVQRLRSERVISDASSSAGRRWWYLRNVAAAVLFFAAGVGSQALLGGRSEPTTDDRPRFALLLHRSANIALTADERQGRVEEYSAWAQVLAAAGKLEMGERLEDATVSFPALSSGRSSGSEEWIAGLFVVRSDTEEEARRIAQSCPHALHGERVELRRIDSGSDSSTE